MLGIGIKAKLAPCALVVKAHVAMLGIGIKAKPADRRGGGRGMLPC